MPHTTFQELRANAIEVLNDAKELVDWYRDRYHLWRLGRRGKRLRREIDKAWREHYKGIGKKP